MPGLSLMRRSIQALSVIAALAGFASAQHRGDIPAALVWDELKGNCPAGLDWASLRGKVVVVSLSPDDVLQDDVDDWKQAAQALRDEPVRFIQVAAGSEFLLDQALEQTRFHGCVLLDSDLTNYKNFKLPLFQRTVVVDQSGFIAGYARGGPDEDEVKDAVRALLDNQPDTGLDETPPQPQYSDPSAGMDLVPSYVVHISPAAQNEFRALGEGGPDTYITKNQPLKLIILELWNTAMARIAFPEKLDEGRYDVTAHIPVADRDQLLQVVREAVEKHFGLSVEKEVRMQRIYRLTACGKPSPQLQPAKSDDKEMRGGGLDSMVGTAQEMGDIASEFEGVLEVPVIDETGFEGNYNYSASSQRPQPEASFDMAHQLGLELTGAERPIEMLVVRKVQ
jgi:uncharacterized protein (TIGR03435 family)